MEKINGEGIVINLTDESKVKSTIDHIINSYGGIDIVVSNAGIFTAGAYIEEMNQSNWQKSMAVNLTSHQLFLKHSIPFLKNGISSSIVLVGSRNVMAPGAGAASYSCAKAGLTQLCRVAALELASHGVRCNIIHPDAVFDTKLWTPEVVISRHQGLLGNINQELNIGRAVSRIGEIKVKELLWLHPKEPSLEPVSYTHLTLPTSDLV